MRFQGLVFRAHNPFWSFSPLSGEGAEPFGGRFNPAGVEALYTSFSATVALAEYHQGFPRRRQPSTLCAYEVDCQDVVDLSDAGYLREQGMDPGSLRCPWELMIADGEIPPSWQIANHLLEQGAAGIVAPSFADNAPEGGKNLVLWRWAECRPHQVKLVDDDCRLPRNQDSWKCSVQVKLTTTI